MQINENEFNTWYNIYYMIYGVDNMLDKFKKIILKYRKFLVFFVSLVIFSLILYDVFKKEIIFYDYLAHNFLVKILRNDILTIIMKFITNLGSGLVLVLISLTIFVIVKDKRKGISVIINLLLITVINLLLKIIIQRPRPDGFNIIIETGYSFPSGHSMMSTAFYGFLIYLLYKNIKNKVLKNIICITLFVIILLIGISRIYLGVHYASDVIGGFLSSIAYLIVFIEIVPKFLKIIDDKAKK